MMLVFERTKDQVKATCFFFFKLYRLPKSKNVTNNHTISTKPSKIPCLLEVFKNVHKQGLYKLLGGWGGQCQPYPLLGGSQNLTFVWLKGGMWFLLHLLEISKMGKEGLDIFIVFTPCFIIYRVSIQNFQSVSLSSNCSNLVNILAKNVFFCQAHLQLQLPLSGEMSWLYSQFPPATHH